MTAKEFPRDYNTDPLAPHPEHVRNVEELRRAMGIPNTSDRASGVVPVDALIYGNAQSDAADAHEPNIVAEDLVRINDSGIVPTEFKVLVLPDESETQIRARRSNIAVPEAYAAMYAHASVTGRIIAMSPAAFSYHDWTPLARLPLVGDRVVFARYAGMLVQGKPVVNAKGHEEPREYRLLNDKDIAAVLEF